MFLGEAIHNKFEDVASATTTDIGAAEGVNVNITGTTTITSFGTARSGIQRLLRFAGALTITHGANLQCPGNISITTAAGDYALCVSRGSGTWEVVAFWPEDAARTFKEVSIVNGDHGGVGYGFSNELIIERNGAAGINFRTPDANSGELNWSSATDSRGATIGWSYDSQFLDIGTRSSGHGVRIYSGDNALAATFDEFQNCTLAGRINLPSGDDYRINDVVVINGVGSAIADLTTSASAGSLPTPDGSVTIADASSPTNAELLEYCVELEAKLEAILATMRDKKPSIAT